jgi:hypothetical protein
MGQICVIWVGCSSIGYTCLRYLLTVVIGIVSAALVENEVGVVCLLGPNIIPAALGMSLDIILDFYLVLRAFRLLIKADEDSQAPEFVVLMSSIALFAWHLV